MNKIAPAATANHSPRRKVRKLGYLPCTRQYADILHRAGKLYVNHTSGERLGDILPFIHQSDIDCLYGRTYPTVVDRTISQERDVLAGGIPSGFVATSPSTPSGKKPVRCSKAPPPVAISCSAPSTTSPITPRPLISPPSQK